MSKSQIGIVGLGVMGRNLALNMADKGYRISVYTRPGKEEDHMLTQLMYEKNNAHQIQSFRSLEEFTLSLEPPRTILLMIPASAVDEMMEQLLPLLSAQDLMIDGGNTHYKETIRREQTAADKGLVYLGCGISGGEKGARYGPSLMPGGSAEGYHQVEELLQDIAAKDTEGLPCCAYIGPSGAGHFVKMVHNGIEYGEMQLLAEVYHLLSQHENHEVIASIFETWNQTDLSSFLLQITVDILRKKEGHQYLLDKIRDRAGNKGTGSWSSQTALEHGEPATVMTDAVLARYVSSIKQLRERLANPDAQPSRALDVLKVEDGYRFARMINHQQGFQLMASASQQYDWALNLSTIARIWTSGCIIRSKLMESLSHELWKQDHLLENPSFQKQVRRLEPAASDVIQFGTQVRVPLPAFSSAYNYWLGMTTDPLPANLIQAQRDYFGAHTYERVDRPTGEFFHTNWEEDA